MILYHATHINFDGFIDDTSQLKGWGNGGKDEHENLGLWCADNLDYCIRFYNLNYKKDLCTGLTLKTKFDDSKILDARLEPEVLLNLEIKLKNETVPFWQYVEGLYLISAQQGEPTLYWDRKLNLPIYQIAEDIKQPAKEKGYKGIVFSETLPGLKHQLEDWDDFYDGKPSILIFEPWNDLEIIDQGEYVIGSRKEVDEVMEKVKDMMIKL